MTSYHCQTLIRAVTTKTWNHMTSGLSTEPSYPKGKTPWESVPRGKKTKNLLLLKTVNQGSKGRINLEPSVTMCFCRAVEIFPSRIPIESLILSRIISISHSMKILFMKSRLTLRGVLIGSLRVIHSCRRFMKILMMGTHRQSPWREIFS